MESELREWAQSRGYEVTWFGGSILHDVFRALERMKAEEELSRRLCEEHTPWLGRPETGAQANAETIILAAIPRPAHVVAFEYRGESQDLILPPTYHDYTGLFEAVNRDLQGFLGGAVHLEVLRPAPLKTLAAWSGFAQYGRNNLAFVGRFGSYAQLVGLTADVALPGGASVEGSKRSMLERCQKCRACIKTCPGGAISDERFLLYADRCLTFHSELDGDLPVAYGRLRRRCVVGCLVCQECCPENKGRLRFERLGEPFTEEETALILGDRDDTPFSQALIDKVGGLKSNELKMTPEGLNPAFRRNLAAVLKGSDVA